MVIAVISLNFILCALNMCLMSNVRAHVARHAQLCLQHSRFVYGHVLIFCRGKRATAALTLWHPPIIKYVREAQRR